MFIEIESVVIVTHENPRNGDRIEDQRQQVTYRIDLTQFAGLVRPLAELILGPADSSILRDMPPSRNGNGTHRVPVPS